MPPSNVSSVTNYFANPNEGFTTTLGTTITSGATTVPLNSTTGLVNGSIFVGIIEPGATNEQVFTGTVNTGAGTITGVVWTRGTNVGHTGGVSIVDYVTGTAFKMMTTGILKQHNQNGTHGAITATSLSTSGNASVGGTTALTGAISGTGYSLATIANPYKFHVYRNAAQNIGNAGFAVLACDTKIYDTGSNVDLVTNKGRFTAPIAGFYQFNALVQASISGTTIMGISLFKNGSRYQDGQFIDTTAAANTVASGAVVSGLISLAANDYVEAQIYGNSGYPIVVGTANATSGASYFEGFLESAT